MILSKSATSLRHEISGERGNKLGAEDVVDMTNAALAAKQENALVILSAMAGNCGCEIKRLPGTSDPSVKVNGMQAISGSASEFSELIAAASESLADDIVTDNELKQAERECSELMTQLQALMALMEAKNRAGKPSGQGDRS